MHETHSNSEIKQTISDGPAVTLSDPSRNRHCTHVWLYDRPPSDTGVRSVTLLVCHSVTLSFCHSISLSLCHSVTVGNQCWITALHVNRQNVCVGLTNGEILILHSVGGTLLPLTTFSCHQQQVKCLTILPPDHTHRKDHHRDNHSWSTTSPHPAHLLVSCGLGFHSYPTPSPSDHSHIPHPNELPPAKLLTWDMTNLQ